MSDPVRNLIVYADGRVEETPYRLEGNYYVQDEGEVNALRRRIFLSDVAYDDRDIDKGNFTMVYVERPDMNDGRPDRGPSITVHGTPIPVTVPLRPKHWSVREEHKRCRAAGGHRPGMNDTCELCGLTGYTIRTMRYLDERDEREAKEAAALRDQLVKLRDENTKLKVENCDLRRAIERATPVRGEGK